jgi:selenocysteine-specific elongation factor
LPDLSERADPERYYDAHTPLPTRRFVIGTAGHVDHGKTTLVRALTGVETDRLPEEKRRGISIELGFAPLDLGGGVEASVVDVPGHRRLVRAMIAGATGMELVLLVVAADEGVMPQTREHVAVCQLLGMTCAVVAVTKADAVEPELAQVAAEEARSLLGDRWRAEAVACSARTGEGLADLRSALRRAVASLPALGHREPARLGVDRVFTVRGTGTVVTGTLVTGGIAIGDPLFVVGERGARPTSARGLEVHDAAVDRAEAPTRLAVNLAGLARDDVSRGEVVTADRALRATTIVDLLVRPGHSLRRGAAVTAHVGTASTPACVDAIDAVVGGAVARLRLARATAIAGGDRVVLRGGVEGPWGAVVGGGVVVDARPERRTSGARRRALAEALASLDPGVTASALVDATSPRPLARDAFGARFAVTATSLARAADEASDARSLARVGDHGWIRRERLEALARRARELVAEHQARVPLDRGIPLETLRARLAGGGAGRWVAEEAIRRAAERDGGPARLSVDGDVVRLSRDAPDARTEATSRAEAIAAAGAQAIATALERAGGAGCSEHTLGATTRASPAELRAALQRLARDGAAVRLGDLWFASRIVDDARAKMTVHYATAPTLTVVQFKALTGLARKQAVAMLEHFDQLGLTRREGDVRVRR